VGDFRQQVFDQSLVAILDAAGEGGEVLGELSLPRLYAGRLSIKVHPVSSLPNIPCAKDEHLSEQRFVPSRFCFQQHVLNLEIAIPGDPDFGPTAGTETTHEEKVIPSFSRACVTGQAREVSPDVVVSSSEHLSGI
jgi:hypothetical protein